MSKHRERLRKLRERRGLKQADLADLCDRLDKVGVWRQSKICRIETGQMALTVEDLEVIVTALDTTMSRFFSARGAA